MRRVKEIKKVTEAEYKVLEVLWESSGDDDRKSDYGGIEEKRNDLGK